MRNLLLIIWSEGSSVELLIESIGARLAQARRPFEAV